MTSDGLAQKSQTRYFESHNHIVSPCCMMYTPVGRRQESCLWHHGMEQTSCPRNQQCAAAMPLTAAIDCLGASICPKIHRYHGTGVAAVLPKCGDVTNARGNNQEVAPAVQERTHRCVMRDTVIP